MEDELKSIQHNEVGKLVDFIEIFEPIGCRIDINDQERF